MAEEAGILKKSVLDVLVAGAALPAETMALVNSIRIDMVSDGPDYFELGLYEPHTDGVTFPDVSNLKIGQDVELKLGWEDVSSAPTLFKGQICSVQAVFGGIDPVKFFIGGFDKLHKLTRGRLTKTWLDVKYSDVASQIASSCGLSADVTATSGTHKYIAMNDQTYLSFILDMARRVGYEVNYANEKLTFKKPTDSSSSVVTLNFGGSEPNILKARFKAQTSGQVSKVRVFSEDPVAKKQIIGVATSLTRKQLGANTGFSKAKSAFGEAEFQIHSFPATLQAEVDAVANAVFDEMAYRYVEVECEVNGDPNIKPGVVISFDGVSDAFKGDYYVTRAIHQYLVKAASGGYITRFFANAPACGVASI